MKPLQLGARKVSMIKIQVGILLVFHYRHSSLFSDLTIAIIPHSVIDPEPLHFPNFSDTLSSNHS